MGVLIMSQRINKAELTTQRELIRKQRKVSAVSKGQGVSLAWTRGQVVASKPSFGEKDKYKSATEVVANQGLAAMATKLRIRDGAAFTAPKQGICPDSTAVRQDPTIRRMRATFNAVLINQHGV